MANLGGEGSEARFEAYVEALIGVIGHADRAGPLRDYCVGLTAPLERKSVEPMAAATAPARTSAQHQSLLHFVGKAPWSDERVLAKVRELATPALERHGPVEAWIIDDTTFPKKGRHSVGVARQYCGQLGKQENCQAAVTVSIANRGASLPVAYRLYLPQDWAEDPERRARAGVPQEIGFATKPEIALMQIRALKAAGVPEGVVLMDAGYGVDTALREAIAALGLDYIAGVQSHMTVWPAGEGPLPPAPWSGRGRPPSRKRRDAGHRPIAIKALAFGLPAEAWETVAWREGAAGRLSSRFARLRVRPAHRDEGLKAPRPEEPGPAGARQGAAPDQGHRGDAGDRQARPFVEERRLPADAAGQRGEVRGGRSAGGERPEPPRRRIPRHPSFDRPDHPDAKISGKVLSHARWPPSPACSLNYDKRFLGIPRNSIGHQNALAGRERPREDRSNQSASPCVRRFPTFSAVPT